MTPHDLAAWAERAKPEAAFKPGDIITIAGDYVLIPNPNRRRWQFWKPIIVQSDVPTKWIVL